MAQSRQRSRLPRNLLIGFLVLVVLYTLAGFLLLPWWLERTLPDQLQQRMGWQTTVTGIRTNPFALSVEAVDLSALDSGGEKVIGFDRLYLDLGFSSCSGVSSASRISSWMSRSFASTCWKTPRSISSATGRPTMP